jgi:hypothetical protein
MARLLTKHRRFGLLVVGCVIAAVGFVGLTPARAYAWSAPCSGVFANKFLGNGKAATGLIGVYSEIQYAFKGLCVQTPGSEVHSWSLSWVSLDGYQSSPGVSIFQGGYARCPPPVVGSCPWNNGTTYYLVYYGYHQGNCGLAFNTGIIKIANATSGTHFFQISKVGSQYNF